MVSVIGLITSIATIAKVAKEGLSVAKQLYNAPEELHSSLRFWTALSRMLVITTTAQLTLLW